MNKRVHTRVRHEMWGFSSAGRAPALHAGGQEFESPNLHHKKDNDICYCPFYFVALGIEVYFIVRFGRK